MDCRPTKKVWLGNGLCVWSLALVVGACSSASEGSGRAPAGSGNMPLVPAGASVPVEVPGAPSAGTLAPGASGGVSPVVPPPGSQPASLTGFAECDDITIMFVIDGSGSMCEVFGGGTRWTQLRNALVGSGGVIPRLAGLASFGMLLYDGSIDLALSTATPPATPSPPCANLGALVRGMDTQCTQFIEVPPAENNGQVITNMFPGLQLGGSTPTDKALQRAFDMLIEERGGGVDLTSRRQYIILATDGQPNDICIGGLGGDGTAQEQTVVQLVERGASMGVTTFVVSLASGDSLLQAHLDQVAKAGDPNNPNATTYNPSTPEALVQDLTSLLSDALNCQLM